MESIADAGGWRDAVHESRRYIVPLLLLALGLLLMP